MARRTPSPLRLVPALLCLVPMLGASQNAIAAQPPGTLLLAALSPELNISPEQLAVAARRHQLSFTAKLECSALDTRLPQLQGAARRAKPEHKADAQQALASARNRYEVLGC